MFSLSKYDNFNTLSGEISGLNRTCQYSAATTSVADPDFSLLLVGRGTSEVRLKKVTIIS